MVRAPDQSFTLRGTTQGIRVPTLTLICYWLGLTYHVVGPMMKSMRSRNEHNNDTEVSSQRELRLLSEVQRSSEATQRDLSNRVGIALGLTNLLLRDLAQKGYLRVTRAGWKRWLYTLTPEGFSRKVYLTVGYIHRVLDHYQKVRQTLREELGQLDLNVESRIAIYGPGEFAELVYLGLKEMGIEEIDVFGSAGSANGRFLGIPVRGAESLRPEEYDRVVVAVLGESEDGCAQLRGLGVASEKLVTFFSDGQTREVRDGT